MLACSGSSSRPERLVGVHIDEEAALRWLTAMATQQAGSDVVVDTEAASTVTA